MIEASDNAFVAASLLRLSSYLFNQYGLSSGMVVRGLQNWAHCLVESGRVVTEITIKGGS